MKTILTSLLIAISFYGFAQPNRPKPVDNTLSVVIKYREVKDTLAGFVIVADKEGYLQRKQGKTISIISVFENRLINPELKSINYFLEDWTPIKPEDVYDFKPRQ